MFWKWTISLDVTKKIMFAVICVSDFRWGLNQSKMLIHQSNNAAYVYYFFSLGAQRLSIAHLGIFHILLEKWFCIDIVRFYMLCFHSVHKRITWNEQLKAPTTIESTKLYTFIQLTNISWLLVVSTRTKVFTSRLSNTVNYLQLPIQKICIIKHQARNHF